MARQIKDVSRMKFGRLQVTGRAVSDSRRLALWACRSECGSEVTGAGAELAKGQHTSCGCARFTHAMTNTPTYRSWKSMRRRCLNENDSSYKNYGGRGISICRQWGEFEAFVRDMGVRPDGTSLDRIDVNGNYEPVNCRWASSMEQSNNTRRNVFVELNGERLTLAEAARKAGVHRTTFKTRIYRGESAQQASRPTQSRSI